MHQMESGFAHEKSDRPEGVFDLEQFSCRRYLFTVLNSGLLLSHDPGYPMQLLSSGGARYNLATPRQLDYPGLMQRIQAMKNLNGSQSRPLLPLVAAVRPHYTSQPYAPPLLACDQ